MRNIQEIIQAINAGRPFALKPDPGAGLPDDEIKETLNHFLTKLELQQLNGVISYCLMELYYNAKKANLKRCYFLKNGLDISVPEQYERGMRSFKKETLEQRSIEPRLLEEYGLRTFVIFHIAGSALRVSIRNNTVMTPQEEKRIAERINRSFAFSSLEDALGSIDESEGAGLGIIIVVLALKKLGYERDSFSIRVENGETVATMVIPATYEWKKRLQTLSDRLVSYIKELPDLPENIKRLRTMLADESVSLNDVARLIAEDPAMSAETLKLANSAAYGAKTKTAVISDGVRRIGVRGLNNILLAYGVNKALGEKTEFIRRLWDRSFRTACYARFVAKSINKEKKTLDDAYAGGLLIDIGTMILSAVNKEIERKIREFSDRKGIPPTMFEELLEGFNNAEVGVLAAEKWEFPSELIDTIRYRHTPESAGVRNRELIEMVYVAECFTRYPDTPYAFANFNSRVLARYSFSKEDVFKAALKRLDGELQQQPI